MTKHNILKYVLFGLTLTSGFFSWFSVFQATKFPEANEWVAPILWFSLFVMMLCLMTILVDSIIAVELVAAAAFLLSLIFAFSLWHLAISIFCTLLMLSGLRHIRKDLDLNIKISLWKSLYTGKVRIVFALAIIISSQYFFIINSANGQKVIPRFDLSSISTRLVEPILGMINPNFKTIQKEGLTVDQFILESQQGKSDAVMSLSNDMIDRQIPANLPADQREVLKQQVLQQIADSQTQLLQKNKELILDEGHKQLSQMVGQDINGSEKVADVFAGLINKKINDYFQPRINGDSHSSAYSYILAAILFLTILPLGSLLSLLWFVLIILVFKLMVRFGVVQIKTITVEREMIA